MNFEHISIRYICMDLQIIRKFQSYWGDINSLTVSEVYSRSYNIIIIAISNHNVILIIMLWSEYD